MWSFFSRDPSKDFNYEISDRINGLQEHSVWALHKAKRKVHKNENVAQFNQNNPIL